MLTRREAQENSRREICFEDPDPQTGTPKQMKVCLEDSEILTRGEASQRTIEVLTKGEVQERTKIDGKPKGKQGSKGKQVLNRRDAAERTKDVINLNKDGVA